MVFVVDHRFPVYPLERLCDLFTLSIQYLLSGKDKYCCKETLTCHHSQGHMSFAKGQKTLSSVDIIYSFCRKNGGVNIVGDWVEPLCCFWNNYQQSRSNYRSKRLQTKKNWLIIILESLGLTHYLKIAVVLVWNQLKIPTKCISIHKVQGRVWSISNNTGAEKWKPKLPLSFSTSILPRQTRQKGGIKQAPVEGLTLYLRGLKGKIKFLRRFLFLLAAEGKTSSPNSYCPWVS